MLAFLGRILGFYVTGNLIPEEGSLSIKRLDGCFFCFFFFTCWLALLFPTVVSESSLWWPWQCITATSLGSLIASQFSSVAQLCPTLCDPMNRSMPGLPVYHKLPEFTQTHVHRVSDAIQPSCPLVPFSSCPQSLPASGSSPMSQLFAWGGQSTGASASASVLPMNTQDLSPSGWTGWISLQSQDTQESSPTPQFKSITFSVLSFLHSPTLTSIHDRWKNHSLDQMDLCWQSDVSAF